MKIVATIQARMSSTRLPKKVMSNIYKNLKTIEIIHERVKKSKLIDKIIVAISTNRADNKLASFLKSKKIEYYRGSENNVLTRIINAAKKYNPKILVHLTGDNPVVDYKIIDSMTRFFIKKFPKYDYLTNNGFFNPNIREIPLGLDVSIMKFSKLLLVKKLAKKRELKEHPTLYFYREGIKKFKVMNLKMKKKWINKDLRLTLDTKRDLIFFKKLFYKLYKKKGILFLTEDIYKLIKNNKNLFNINKKIKQKIPKI